jgi:oleate hydratase
METVYQLLNVERGVPEVFGSIYDRRELIKSKSTVFLFAKRWVEKSIIGRLLEEYRLI